jgi:HAD superfamily 5'-nucleotidase-like hydrolase
MSIYVNRVLNMKHIKAIGFDMDHTLVQYYSDRFEELTFNIAIKKLIEDFKYPKQELNAFKFDFYDAIRGLVVDRENGNILKVSVHSKIKSAYHGTKVLNYRDQMKIYKGTNVDLRDSNYTPIDTAFSIAYTIIYAQLVNLKDEKPDLNLPSYGDLSDDVISAVDIAHRDGSIKKTVRENLEKYIIPNKETVEVLERFKKYGKRLLIITNSDYEYSKALLDYTINPFLKDHKDWSELFEVTVTLSAKPRFFTDKLSFLKVDPKSGKLENFDKKITPGIYQGGYAVKIQEDLGLEEDQILYLGDHIYGDVLRLKKTCGWRTALVVEEMSKEVKAYKNTKKYSVAIDELMQQKSLLRKRLMNFMLKSMNLAKMFPKMKSMRSSMKLKKLIKNWPKILKSMNHILIPNGVK